MRKEGCAFEDGPRGDVNAECLDNHVDVFECFSDRVAIKRVSRHFIEVRILDWHTCRGTCQCADTVAGAERGFHRFKSDARLAPMTRTLAISDLKHRRHVKGTAALESGGLELET